MSRGRLWVPALEAEDLAVNGGCLLVSLPGERSLAALAVDEAARRRIPVRIATRPPSAFAARRALAGGPSGRPGLGRRRPHRAATSRSGALRVATGGQALPALLGAGLILILAALALAAIGGAATGKGRVQRAADLAALSAVRSMRDDVPRLLAPPRLSGRRGRTLVTSPRPTTSPARGSPAIDAARRNRVDPGRLRLSFPDATADPPLRARVTVTGEIDPDQLDRRRTRRRPPADSGGRLGGRRGVGPGVLLDRDAGAGGGWRLLRARSSIATARGCAPTWRPPSTGWRRRRGVPGLDLVVVSGFRSDAEQAELFARHPDPRWVAPPGHSLHRCATELDLGPSSAYGWLAANAGRFGFVRRYSWEAWHFGYAAGPPPCSQAGNAVLAGGAAR